MTSLATNTWLETEMNRWSWEEWINIGITTSHLAKAEYPETIRARYKHYSRVYKPKKSCFYESKKSLPYDLEPYAKSYADMLTYKPHLPRVRCPGCNKFVALTKSGTMRKHSNCIYVPLPPIYLPQSQKLKFLVAKYPEFILCLRQIYNRKDLSWTDQVALIKNAIDEKLKAVAEIIEAKTTTIDANTAAERIEDDTTTDLRSAADSLIMISGQY